MHLSATFGQALPTNFQLRAVIPRRKPSSAPFHPFSCAFRPLPPPPSDAATASSTTGTSPSMPILPPPTTSSAPPFSSTPLPRSLSHFSTTFLAAPANDFQLVRAWGSSRRPPLSRLWSAAERTLQNQAHTIEMSARLAFELLGRFKYNVTGGAPGAPGPSAHRLGYGGGLHRGLAAEAVSVNSLPLLTPAPPSGGQL